MQVLDIKELEQRAKIMRELNIELDTKWEGMRRQYELDFDRLNKKYEEIYKSISENVMKQSEVASINALKNVHNVDLKEIVENIEKEKEQPSLTESIVSNAEEAITLHDSESNIKNGFISTENAETQEDTIAYNEEADLVDEENIEEGQNQDKKKGSFLRRVLKRS